MMKMYGISPHDQEMLSAYLDGQLSSKEIARLQKRLQDDRKMQIALDELRSTRAALRSLPMLRAPRNFTLTPQMVGSQTAARRPAYPPFGFASLVATLLLVLVFIADRTSFVNTAQTAVLESAAQSTQMEELVETMVVEGLATEGITAPQAEAMQLKEAPMAAADQGEDSSRMAEGTPEEGVSALTMPYPESGIELFAEPVMDDTEAAAESLTASEMQSPAGASPWITPTLTATPTPTPTPTKWLINGTEVLGVGGGAPDTPRDASTPAPEPSETPSPTPSPTCTLEPTPLPTDTPVPTDTPLPTDTAAPVAEALQMQLSPSETPAPLVSQADQVQDEQAGQDDGGQPPTRLSSRTIFLAVEIVLGLLAVGSAFIFVYLYRKAG